jgi:N-acetylglucosamine-6-phosphate deacetylase
MASIQQAENAVEKGVSLITHLFNAMIPFHHRDPGLVGLLGSNHKQVFYSMIVDGIHSHPASVKIAYKAFPQGIILITDAIEAMGIKPGKEVKLGSKTVDILENKAFISGTQTLAGSIATMDFVVRTFKESTGCSIVEALEAASLHPAQLLGISDKKGTLNYGSDADFIMIDHNLFVHRTYIGGELVWSKNKI